MEEKSHRFRLVTARVIGNASGVQVSRYVGLVYSKNLLDAAAEFPRGRRQSEGPLRRCLPDNG